MTPILSTIRKNLFHENILWYQILSVIYQNNVIVVTDYQNSLLCIYAHGTTVWNIFWLIRNPIFNAFNVISKFFIKTLCDLSVTDDIYSTYGIFCKAIAEKYLKTCCVSVYPSLQGTELTTNHVSVGYLFRWA